MPGALPASLLDLLRPWQVSGDDRIALEGVAWAWDEAGAPVFTVRQMQATALRLAAGMLASADAGSAWSLEPLAAAEGMLRAQIADAHLMFDADVHVPVRQGRIDFNQATVAHVGPDSRMGVSRLGVYVDAPNGRSYLYQFSTAPVAGVEFEKRGPLLAPWSTQRGRLELRPFAEGLLRQGAGSAAEGVTAPSRVLLDRTTLSGHLQLGDGRIEGAGLQVELTGAAQHRNLLRVHSPTAARSLDVAIEAVAMKNLAWEAGGAQLRCDEITGSLALHLELEDSQLRATLDATELRASGLQLRARHA